ncbi:MAG: hypothetical protein DMG57_13775 [Acidobacteria bacterium]|nr:MAG: hypothetical protein DMG57_13775 [Acidobacteriota bacterium]
MQPVSVSIVTTPPGLQILVDRTPMTSPVALELVHRLGPFKPAPPDGFAVPVKPKYTLADPVKIVIGAQEFDPVWVGAATGRVGLTVQFHITDQVPHATTVELKIRAKGRESNSVPLTLQ